MFAKLRSAKGIMEAGRFSAYQATAGVPELIESLNQFRGSKGRRRFAWACLAFDRAVMLVLSSPVDSDLWRLASQLRDQLLDFIQNAENVNWQGALDKMALDGTAKALDRH